MTEKHMKFFVNTVSLASVVVSPITLMLLWNWFVVKIGAPHIDYWLAFGLATTISFVFSGVTKMNEKVIANDIEYMFSLSLLSVSNTISALGLGYIVHLFV